jgi:hypothetical protein
MNQKTVFLSYRRALSKHLARSIYQDLKQNEWDVFLDVSTLDSGDFDRIILNQIAARAHFILLISPGSLERCVDAGDWVLREIEEAVRLQRNIVPIIEEGADFSREIAYLPSELHAKISKKNALPLSHFYFDAAMDALRTRFLKSPEYITITAPPPAERAEIERRLEIADAPLPPPSPARKRSIDILPAPFAWIDIPGSPGKAWKGAPFKIAKYPITNAQFRVFVDAGGYNVSRWWTEAGWAQREQEDWTEPRFWGDRKWNGEEQPIVGVSWFEAVAFCQWLSQATGECITLPSEDQWQSAAQGDDGREYPWGNEWDCGRCNNSTSPCKNLATTPVRTYEGKGDSPFGVVDMAGNVLEWCLTDYNNRINDVDILAEGRVLRGGSWNFINAGYFRAAYRIWDDPENWYYDYVGFRCARFS